MGVILIGMRFPTAYHGPDRSGVRIQVGHASIDAEKAAPHVNEWLAAVKRTSSYHSPDTTSLRLPCRTAEKRPGVSG